MKQSKLFTKTQKNAPADEVSKNAQLLIRAGFVHKEMAGVYSFLPLGLRVLEKIKQIAREEMNQIGGQELIMSGMQNKKVWEKTNRWDENVVDVWFKSKLNAGGEIGFGWSHEEPITNMMINHINSYKDLPTYVYQFQTKLRNEMRAKSGIMRGREFVMQDMYSYCANEEQHEKIYTEAIEAYLKFYQRVGLGEDTFVTYAAGGAFTEFSHEFQTLSEIGEDLIFKIPGKDEYQNKEIVKLKIETGQDKNEEQKEMEEILRAGVVGVEQLCQELNIGVEKTTKTIFFETTDGRYLAAAIRGDRDIDETKLKIVSGADGIFLLDEKKVLELTGAKVGYAGMLNLPENFEQYWDYSCEGRINFEMGANKTDYHNINVNFNRDIEKPEKFYDLAEAREGDVHPESGEKYETHHAVEVGNIFNFGTKKCEEMDLYFKNEAGENIPVWLGSYGIGITRVMGLIVEKKSDDQGIIWPETVAPFQVHLINIGKDEKAEEIYQEMLERGIEVLWDDRIDKRAGEKFADADLIGIPYRVLISKKSLENGGVEVKKRSKNEAQIISEDELFDIILK